MQYAHKYTTIDEQIDLLKRRGLIFQSEENAKYLLSKYGYYSIINGYKDPYTIVSDSIERYKEGVSFEQIYSLFSLDHAIRNQVMLTTLDIEEHLKAAAAEVIGAAFGADQKEYLKFSNYQNRHNTKPQFTLSEILKSLNETSLSGKDPIRHHREKYGNVPPWVLFKSIYLSTLINYIRLFKPKQKAEIISILYPISIDDIDVHISNIFFDTLFMCLEYRNLAAHTGRIYNYEPKSKIRVSDESIEVLQNKIVGFNNIFHTHSLGTFVLILDLFTEDSFRNDLRKIIQKEVERHKKLYPSDADYLMSSIGIEHIAYPINH